jgi:hypothetical protein
MIDLQCACSVLAVFQVTATHSAVAPSQERQPGARHSHAATTLVAVRWQQLAIAVGLASFSSCSFGLPLCLSRQQQKGVAQRLAA